MKKILNSFFNSSFFDLVPTILQKRIRKIFKVYFCISNKNKLPKANYNIDFTEKYQKFIVNNFRTKNYISRNSCNYLSKLVSKKKIKKVNFLDFGAGDINTFLELKKIKKLNYYYFDVLKKNKIIYKIEKYYKFKNFFIINNILNNKKKFNFVFFGSSLGYSNYYQKILEQITNNKCKYILITGITFFSNNKNKKNIIAKQINLLPKINYVYFFNKQRFFNFFIKKKYKVNFIKKNQFKKINFNNLKFFSKKIEYLDVLFEKI